MSGFWIPLLAGAATGVLSAWGIGGGTLLLLVMTLLLGVEPRTAQGINLLYFLPTAGMGLLSHRKTVCSTGSCCAARFRGGCSPRRAVRCSRRSST